MGRYGRHNSPGYGYGYGNGNGYGSGKAKPATYSPFDLTVMGGPLLNPRVLWWATNMTRFTLQTLVPGGMLTDLQSDIVNLMGNVPDYGSIAMDNFAYDLVSTKEKGK
jgi:hypothetical protein